MRTRCIASLISLSLASAHVVCAQESLWFTPSQPPASTTAASPGDQSFTERFGGLLNKQKSHTTVTKPPVNSASKVPVSTPHGAVAPVSGQRSDGVREFEIPWSLTATAPFDFDQHANSSQGSKPLSTVKAHGAQVRPMAAQVKPNYVPRPTVTTAAPVTLPSAKLASVPTMTAVTETVPWEKNAIAPIKPTASTQANRTSVALTAPSALPAYSISQVGPSNSNSQLASPPVIEPRPRSLTAKPLLPTVPPTTANESLIVPIPEEKLDQAIVRQVPTVAVAAPRIAAPTLPPGTGRLASSPIQLAAPNQYVFVDDQPSATDQAGSSVVPAPPVSERLTDQADQQTAEDKTADAKTSTTESGKKYVADKTPLLTTESMIGPLKGAEELFHRLGQESDMRHTAARIESGPRGDASNYAWMPAAYTWISPALYHYPLYFEQPNLERYGIGHRPIVQPLASSIHFFGSIPLVPYKTLTHHPREKVYTLGNLRPGNCVPVQRGVILGQSTVGEVVMFWEECSGYQ